MLKEFCDKRFKFRSTVFFFMTNAFLKREGAKTEKILFAFPLPLLFFLLSTISRNHHKLVLFILRMSGFPDNFIILYFTLLHKRHKRLIAGPSGGRKMRKINSISPHITFTLYISVSLIDSV